MVASIPLPCTDSPEPPSIGTQRPGVPTLSGRFSSLLLADSTSPRMIDNYPSFSESPLFGANAYYPFGPGRGGSAAIPTAGEFLNDRACICMPAY